MIDLGPTWATYWHLSQLEAVLACSRRTAIVVAALPRSSDMCTHLDGLKADLVDPSEMRRFDKNSERHGERSRKRVAAAQSQLQKDEKDISNYTAVGSKGFSRVVWHPPTAVVSFLLLRHQFPIKPGKRGAFPFSAPGIAAAAVSHQCPTGISVLQTLAENAATADPCDCQRSLKLVCLFLSSTQANQSS